MLSLKKNFLFLHVPKTGGTSVNRALMRYSSERNRPRPKFYRFEIEIARMKSMLMRSENISLPRHFHRAHESIRSYHSTLEKNIFDDLFTFSIVRNPWDRVISSYFYYSTLPFGRGEVQWDDKKFRMSILKTRPMRHYVCFHRLPPFWEKQKWFHENISPFFWKQAKSLNYEMDFILRFENLDEDWKILCAKIKIPHKPLRKANVSLSRPAHKHYSLYYRGHPELIDLVREKFREEIEFFGYDYEQV